MREVGCEWASSWLRVAFLAPLGPPPPRNAELLSLGAGSSSISGKREEWRACSSAPPGTKDAPILTSTLEGTWEMGGERELSTMSSGSTSTATLYSSWNESLCRAPWYARWGSVFIVSMREGRLGIMDSVRLSVSVTYRWTGLLLLTPQQNSLEKKERFFLG